MTSLAFALRLTQRVSVKRLPAVSGNPAGRGGPVVIATNVPCVPFYPASVQLLQRTQYNGPGFPFETLTAYAVQGGDELVDLNSITYKVFYSAPWLRDGTTFYQVGVQKEFRG